MLNYIWGAMIVIGILFGAVNGKMPELTNAALDSAKESVTLCITMLGVMSLWTGIMEVARSSGLIDSLTKKIPKNHPAKEYIATNIIANVLGLGWAATPAGLKAMEELSKIDKERHGGKITGIASNEMCTFLIINISSLQLIPVNMIAYRSQYGSVNPAAIVAPAIMATALSTIIAVIFCKFMDKKQRV